MKEVKKNQKEKHKSQNMRGGGIKNRKSVENIYIYIWLDGWMKTMKHFIKIGFTIRQ